MAKFTASELLEPHNRPNLNPRLFSRTLGGTWEQSYSRPANVYVDLSAVAIESRIGQQIREASCGPYRVPIDEAIVDALTRFK